MLAASDRVGLQNVPFRVFIAGDITKKKTAYFVLNLSSNKDFFLINISLGRQETRQNIIWVT